MTDKKQTRKTNYHSVSASISRSIIAPAELEDLCESLRDKVHTDRNRLYDAKDLKDFIETLDEIVRHWIPVQFQARDAIREYGYHGIETQSKLMVIGIRSTIANRQSLTDIELPSSLPADWYEVIHWVATVKKRIENKDEITRKNKPEKIALIAAHLQAQPYATSPDIEKATGINEAEVRKLWKPIKKELRNPKRNKRSGWKDKGSTQAIDETAECSNCTTPKRPSFECNLCKEVITTECKECHYTNSHPEDAIP